jgi:hypothetical protein
MQLQWPIITAHLKQQHNFYNQLDKVLVSEHLLQNKNDNLTAQINIAKTSYSNSPKGTVFFDKTPNHTKFSSDFSQKLLSSLAWKQLGVLMKSNEENRLSILYEKIQDNPIISNDQLPDWYRQLTEAIQSENNASNAIPVDTNNEFLKLKSHVTNVAEYQQRLQEINVFCQEEIAALTSKPSNDLW